ncbi:MAG TPA: hypothetical protein VHO03_17040 [Ignavibacteriales bacterium]|nr:hypothetical protein [Ignavibacteriales bacterium]
MAIENNISTQLHEKGYGLSIYNSTDTGSGVKSLHIYAQATDLACTGNNADFSLASLVGVIEDVDNTPSYSKLSDVAASPKVLVLRNKDSYPVTTALDKTPKHNANNVYPFIFRNYINGKYYAFWVLAADKAGNLEVLDQDSDSGKQQTTTKPLFYKVDPLVDNTAPEFDGPDGLVTLSDLTFSGALATYTVQAPAGVTTDDQAKAYFNDHIVAFKISGAAKQRYITSATFRAGTPNLVSFEMDTQGLGNANADAGTTKLLPTVKIVGGIGTLSLSYPISNSVNLKGYKIERGVTNDPASPAALRNLTKDEGTITWILAGYINAESFTDTNLKLSATNLVNTPDTQKFLYRVTPVSIFTNGGAEILGTPIYTTKKDFYEKTYRPSAGEIPNAVPITPKMETGANGQITLSWNKATDSNGDLKGYEIQRQRIVNGTAESFTTIADKEYTSYEAGTGYDYKFTDSGLETYLPDKVEYAYRVRTTDFAGNVSGFTTFKDGANSTIKAFDATAPDNTLGTITKTVIGKIGGWQGEIQLPASGYEDVTGALVYAYSASTTGGVASATGRYLGTFNIEPGERHIVFQDFSAPSNQRLYAQYKFKLKDKNGNISTSLSGFFPATPVPSETPQIAVDKVAPSTQLFTLAMALVPDASEPAISSATATTVVVTGITAGANELKDKTITIVAGSDSVTRPILSNTVTSGGSTTITVADWGGATPQAGGKALIQPAHVRLDVTVPGNENATAGAASTQGDTSTGAVLSDTSKGWTVDAYKGWNVTINGQVFQAVSNTANTVTLNGMLDFSPSGKAFTISLPTDIAGYEVYKGKWNGTAVENWVFVTDTMQGFTTNFSVVDRNIEDGVYKYGIISYDANNNYSSIKASAATITITDVTAPGVPEVRSVYGGAGTIQVNWNRTSDDIDHYELYVLDKNDKYVIDNNGAYIAQASRTATVTKEQVTTENFIIFGLLDSKDDIALWKYKVVAFDRSGNNISTMTAKTPTGKIYLNDYVPATGSAPSNPTDFTATSDNDGNVIIKIPKANLNTQTGSIIIQRIDNSKYKSSDGQDHWEADWKTIAVIPGVELTSAGAIVTDLSYTDYVNDRLICKYRLQAVGFNGLPNSGYTAEKTVNVVDFTGFTLANLDVTVSVDIKMVKIKFKDTVDKKNASYEIWRTNDLVTAWDSNNFFTNTAIQPKVVHGNWERLSPILPSTKGNGTQTTYDYLQFTDRDWDENGQIQPEHTKLSTQYNGKAIYAIVAIDQWNNRGNVYYVQTGNSGTFGASCIVSLPVQYRETKVPIGAFHCDFNKGVQSSMGHTPSDIPQGVLYKGYGVQPTGPFGYNLPHLAGDTTVILRKLEKSLVNMNVSLTSIVDVFLYDTKKDTISSDWRWDSSKSWYNEAFSSTRGGSKEFPETIVAIACTDKVLLFNYDTGSLWMQFNLGFGTDTTGCYMIGYTSITSIHFNNGLLYVTHKNLTGHVDSLSIIDFIKDEGRIYSNYYTGGQYPALRGKRSSISTRNQVAVFDGINIGIYEQYYNVYTNYINGKGYTALGSTLGLNILCETDNKVINSIDTSKFIKVVIHEGYLFALKDTDRSIYRSAGKVSTLFQSYPLESDLAENSKAISDTSSPYNGQTFARIKLTSEISESIAGTKIVLVDGNSANPNSFIAVYNSGRFIYFDRGAVDIATLYSSGNMTIDSFGLNDVMTNAIYTGSKAVLYDGKDDRSIIANNAALNFGTGDYTWQITLSILKHSDNATILSKGASKWQHYLYLNTDASGNKVIRFGKYDGTTADYIDVKYSVNQILNIVFVRTGTTVKAYLNGTLVATKTSTVFGANTDDTSDLAFGYVNPQPGNIKILNARLWNYALSASRIYELSQGASIRTDDKWGSRQLLQTWGNHATLSYETFSSSDSENLTAINTTGQGTALSTLATSITSGTILKVKCNLTLNSGTAPKVYLADSSWANVTPIKQLSAGANDFYFITTGTAVTALVLTDNGVTANFSISNFRIIKEGCVAEYLADNYDPSTGTWKSTENAEGGVSTLNATQATASYRPVSVNMPNRYVTKAFPKTLSPAKDKQLAVAMNNTLIEFTVTTSGTTTTNVVTPITTADIYQYVGKYILCQATGEIQQITAQTNGANAQFTTNAFTTTPSGFARIIDSDTAEGGILILGEIDQ